MIPCVLTTTMDFARLHCQYSPLWSIPCGLLGRFHMSSLLPSGFFPKPVWTPVGLWLLRTLPTPSVIDQACSFEALHDSLAVCSSMLYFQCPVGFGSEDEAAVKTLEQILPSKGVPAAEVRSRGQAAIKVFGTKALQQALETKNVWLR